MGGYDLHTHSTCSDGTTDIEDNVAAAVSLGLDGLGVTDHDTTEPFDRAVAAAEGTGLDVVLGTEFSAELDGSSVHVLGLWIDPDDAPLRDEMDRLRNERARRAEDIVARFHDLGVTVSLDRVRELAGAAPIGRPHIAQAVVETGAAPDIRTVFDDWLADGAPAYVPKYAVDPVRAVELIRGAGGVAVVAHPGLYGTRRGPDGRGIDDEVVEAMATAGMAGIEVDHPDHRPEERARFRVLAERLGLLTTGGSDYHGAAKDLRLGQETTPAAVVAELRERRPARAT